MKFSYKFSNLCGTVYQQGNVVFTPNDGVLSPVGNRVTAFDLKNNKSTTFACENRKNISRIALSPDGNTLITVDEEGGALLVSARYGTILHHFNFKKPVRDIQYSPCGRYFAITHGHKMQVWFAPGRSRDFAPFRLLHTFPGLFDECNCIDWSSDSRFLVVGSDDMTCRVFTLQHVPGFKGVTLSGHRNVLVGTFFEHDSLDLYTIAKDCSLYVWTCSHSLPEALAEFEQDRSADPSEEDGSEDDSEPLSKKPRVDMNKKSSLHWQLSTRHLFIQANTQVASASFHRQRALLVLGFANGVFALYEMPEFNQIHSLCISQQKVTSVSINSTGEWLAFGCRSLGQLLVWEWASETYLLKQQGHFYDMNCLAYSPDGQYVATGGDDSKVKIWDTSSGFCFVTFSEHTGGVTAVCFTSSGKAVLSASLDGTVRACDLHRYRNFRTFASPRPVQFNCLAIDSSSELVCAGSQDTFEIFVWSMQTGRLLELLAGHEGPVSGVAFQPGSAELVSCSWDRTLKFWDVMDSQSARETRQLGSDAVALTFRPDGRQFAVSTLDGQITFWDMSGRQIGSIEGRRDLGSGRRTTDLVTAKHSSGGKCFTGLCYTANGQCLLAGGRSKFVCIYEVSQQVLLKKFQISRNRSFDGMQRLLNSANMTEAGPLDLIDVEDGSDHEDIALPGVSKGDMSSRRTKPEIRTKSVMFSPTGRAWAAATTEGLLIYSLDVSVVFDPLELDEEVTPDSIRRFLADGKLLPALVMSLRLNEPALIQQVLEAVPLTEVQLLSKQLSQAYAKQLLEKVAVLLESSPHLHFYLMWSCAILQEHGRLFKRESTSLMPSLQALHKSLSVRYDDLSKLCNDNQYTLQYVLTLASLAPAVRTDDNSDTPATSTDDD